MPICGVCADYFNPNNVLKCIHCGIDACLPCFIASNPESMMECVECKKIISLNAAQGQLSISKYAFLRNEVIGKMVMEHENRYMDYTKYQIITDQMETAMTSGPEMLLSKEEHLAKVIELFEEGEQILESNQLNGNVDNMYEVESSTEMNTMLSFCTDLRNGFDALCANNEIPDYIDAKTYRQWFVTLHMECIEFRSLLSYMIASKTLTRYTFKVAHNQRKRYLLKQMEFKLYKQYAIRMYAKIQTKQLLETLCERLNAQLADTQPKIVFQEFEESNNASRFVDKLKYIYSIIMPVRKEFNDTARALNPKWVNRKHYVPRD